MKQIRYIIAAFCVSVFFVTTYAAASAPNTPGEEQTQESTLQPVPEQDKEDIRKKSLAARKIVVARVNGAEINKYDLLGMMNRVANAYYSNVKEPTEEITREIKKQALDRLIFEELAVKEAVRQGIQPVHEKVEAAITGLKSAYGSGNGFQGYLDEIGLTEDGLRARIERGQLLEGITGRQVYQKVTKKEDVVQKAYEEYRIAGKLRKADEFRVKEILVMDAGSEEKSKKRAEQLLVEIKKHDNDFGKLILDGTFIVRNMPINKEKFPVIYEKMKGMEVGEFSAVVFDNNTFHIFQVLKNDLARDLTPEEARGFIEDSLAPYFQEQRRAEWIEELRKDANVEILDEDLKE